MVGHTEYIQFIYYQTRRNPREPSAYGFDRLFVNRWSFDECVQRLRLTNIVAVPDTQSARANNLMFRDRSFSVYVLIQLRWFHSRNLLYRVEIALDLCLLTGCASKRNIIFVLLLSEKKRNCQNYVYISFNVCKLIQFRKELKLVFFLYSVGFPFS